jgi:hypothetical protein
MLYIAGNKLPLQAFSLSGDQFNSVPTSQTSTIFGETGFSGLGANPIISANGTQNAIVWALDNSGFKTKDPAILYAYDAYDLSHEFYNSTMNPSRDRAAGAVKFSGAVVANGMVYVQGNGAVTVYGLLPKE